ncbi:MAG: DUF1491 family protein [Caulobacterales bacterium]|nr:DUF1491 family protein [Caulobacterales bacterium]
MLIATDVWVSALIRRAQMAGAAAVVVRKGDARAGAVLVKAYNTVDRSARLYAETIGLDGDRLWIEPHPEAPEFELDAYAARQADYDPDLWLVEIEDRQGRHFLVEDVDGDKPRA